MTYPERTDTPQQPSGDPASPDRRRRKPPLPPAKRWARKRPWLIFALLYLAVLIPELVLRKYTVPQFGGVGLFLILLFSAVPAAFCYGLVMALPEKWAFRLSVGYCTVFWLFFSSQIVYFDAFSRHYIATSAGNAGQVLQFMNIILLGIWHHLLHILFMALPLIFLVALGREYLAFRSRCHVAFAGIMAAAALVLHFAIVLILPIFGTSEMSAYDLYHKTFDTEASVQKLGMVPYFRLDLHRAIFDIKQSGSLNIQTKPSETDPPADPTTDGSQPSNPDDPTVSPVEQGLNVLDIDFDRLIAQETDETVKQMHQYFSSLTPSAKNDKTGMFQGHNLIFVTAESFSHLAIDPELTPTLYKMQHEGFNFTNFYTAGWGVSTTDGEYANLTGTIPKAGVWSMYRMAVNENLMPLTMVSQLSKLGYSARAYHNHDYDYYDRDIEYPWLGYAYKAYGLGLDVKKTWPESDLEMIDLTTADFINDQPFHVYYLTVSGHATWNFKDNYIASKNRELVAHLDYDDEVRGYLACSIELDRAMELLLLRLEDAGIAEKTVICIAADHNPYMFTPENLKELAGHDVDQTFEVYKNACILYEKGMTSETIDQPCCALDLLPTLSNLFGLEFDSRLYMGRDVFSDAAPLVEFLDRSWITDRCSYNAKTGEVISLDGTEIPDSYVKEIKDQVYNKFTVSTWILENDYWRKLFG